MFSSSAVSLRDWDTNRSRPNQITISSYPPHTKTLCSFKELKAALCHLNALDQKPHENVENMNVLAENQKRYFAHFDKVTLESQYASN